MLSYNWDHLYDCDSTANNSFIQHLETKYIQFFVMRFISCNTVQPNLTRLVFLSFLVESLILVLFLSTMVKGCDVWVGRDWEELQMLNNDKTTGRNKENSLYLPCTYLFLFPLKT